MTSSADSRFPAWVNGRLYAPDEPAVSPFDAGFLLGLAVFDTLLYDDGCRYFEDEHLARLEHGAGELGIAWPPPWQPAEALDEYCEAIGDRTAALRLTLTRGVPGAGPTLVVFGRALERAPEPGVAVLIEDRAKMAGEKLEGIKSTNRLRNILARERATREGAWDVLLCTEEGDLTEATIANVFCVLDGELHTPAVDRGCLPGIMREKVLEEAHAAGLPVHVGRVEAEALERADEVFLTNTTGRLIPVVEVRGVVSGLPGSAGRLTTLLRGRIRALEERYRSSYTRDS